MELRLIFPDPGNVCISWQGDTSLEMHGEQGEVGRDRQTPPCTNSFAVTLAHAFVRERSISRALSGSWLRLPVLSGSRVRQPHSHSSSPHESLGASVSYDL